MAYTLPSFEVRGTMTYACGEVVPREEGTRLANPVMGRTVARAPAGTAVRHGREGTGHRKTSQELYAEIVDDNDEGRKRAFVEALRAGDVEGFVRDNGCAADEEEVGEFLEERWREMGPHDLTAEGLG